MLYDKFPVPIIMNIKFMHKIVIFWLNIQFCQHLNFNHLKKNVGMKGQFDSQGIIWLFLRFSGLFCKIIFSEWIKSPWKDLIAHTDI